MTHHHHHRGRHHHQQQQQQHLHCHHYYRHHHRRHHHHYSRRHHHSRHHHHYQFHRDYRCRRSRRVPFTSPPHPAHFDSKGQVEDYIRTHGPPFTTVRFSFYFNNLLTKFAPTKCEDGSHGINILTEGVAMDGVDAGQGGANVRGGWGRVTPA